jgi:PKD repeat protein
MLYELKKTLAVALFLLLAAPAISFTSTYISPTSHQFDASYEAAYSLYPEIPKGLLEAVSFSYNRINHITYDSSSIYSCIGLPRTYGIMGLTENGKGFFKNNLTYVAVLSGYSKEELKDDASKSILGYASAYSQLLSNTSSVKKSWEDHASVLRALSELPSLTTQQDFALNSQVYVMLWFLNQPAFQNAFNFPNPNINFTNVFGAENYKVLSSTRIDINDEKIKSGGGEVYQKLPGPCSDFPGSIWVAADASNFSSRSGTSISAITIHDIEGTYAGAISWFQNPISNVSAHYCLRSIDGQVTQMVCDVDKGWHVGTENPYAIGLEHEGIASIQGWYTEELYQASAAVCLDAMNDFSIDPLRAHTGPPESGITTLGNCIKLKGHQHFANSTHTDPGIFWDWDYFYTLLNDGTTPGGTTYTTATGNVFDSGGSGGNYGDDERLYWTIAPAGATSVTLTFSQFDLESNWDYLYIYDGNSVYDDLIGVYTGTTSPGTVTAESGSIFLEFRSDCATNNPGWSASYTSSTAPLSCPVPSALNETDIIPVAATLNWAGTASTYLLRFRDHTYDPWTYSTITGNSKSLSGLSANSEYYWGVASLCTGDTSSFAGSMFTTPAAIGAFSISECDGDFRDSGGPLGVYLNTENYTYTINTSGVITVVFTSFNVENNYDYLYIHDGNSIAAAQIPGSPFTGTSLPSTFTSSGNSLTFRFTSDNSTTTAGWNASWTCIGGTVDTTPPTTNISTPNLWETADYTVNFTDADDPAGTGIKQSFWNASDYNGTEWRSNEALGFFNDNFSASIHADWTALSGTWAITSAELNQTDEASSNTNIFTSLTQTSGNEYLYHWTGQINGTGTNRRAGLHFFCDDPTLPNRGNSYFVYWRTDSDKCQIYEVNSDVFTLQTDDIVTINPNINYDFKIYYNPVTGNISAFLNDVLVSSWTDPSPLATGNSISIRSGNANMIVDDLIVYKSRSSAETITIGSASDMIRYQNTNPSTPAGKVTSIVLDNSDNLSGIDSELYNIDWTTPAVISQVNDGTAADIDNTTNTTTLEANWSTSSDTHSSVAKYYYAIGSTAGATDILGWTDNGISASMIQSGLSLIVGNTYYISVKAENGAGLQSASTPTDGILIDNPTAVPVASFNSSSSTICAGDSIQLINSSTDATSYNWIITSGSPGVSAATSPWVIFPSSGTYSVQLTATGPGGSDVITQNVTVTYVVPPIAAATPSSSTVTLPSASVSFTNSSSDATSYFWDFGDGNTSSLTNPSNSYSTSGTYSVMLVAMNGTCVNDTVYINISVIDIPPVAAFNASSSTLCEGDSVQLVNTSTNAISYSWVISGGMPATSSAANPWVVFPSSGSYSIQLTANGSGGSDITTQNITLTYLAPPAASATSSSDTITLPAATINFTNSSLDATSYYWDFGDGNSSTDTDPWYAYTTAGSYGVMLVAMNGICANDTTYITVVVTNPVSIAEIDDLNINIYPNPGDEIISVSISNSIAEIGTLSLFDMMGKIVYSKSIKIGNSTANYSLSKSNLQLASGQYVLRIITPSFTQTEQLIFR